MDERKEIHEFVHYRIFERNVFSASMVLFLIPLKNMIRSLFPYDLFYAAALAVIGLLLFLTGAAAAAYLPIFRKNGCWWVEEGNVVIAPEGSGIKYVIKDPDLLYFSDPLMIGCFLQKKCVLEIKCSNSSLMMMSGPMSRKASRNENPLWPVFAEIRNRNMHLIRVNDTQGHMVDYWYVKSTESAQKQFVREYYSDAYEKVRSRIK